MNACFRREFTTAGVAAGVAAGFNAPIGGLLFAMEDLSSFWTKASSLQTFYCAVIAAIIAELFNTAFSGFQYRTQFGTLTESVSWFQLLLSGDATIVRHVLRLIAILTGQLFISTIARGIQYYVSFRYWYTVLWIQPWGIPINPTHLTDLGYVVNLLF